MRRAVMFLLVLGLAVPAARGQPSYYQGVDVPTDLGPPTYLPWDVVRNDAGTYSTPISLPPNAPLDALHRLGAGGWLVSVDAPTDLGGVTWDPRDVFEFTGAGSFAAYGPFGGAVAQIPEGSDVDAVYLDPVTGEVIVSFDVPTSIGVATHQPADLVRYNGAAFDPIPVFDASAAAIPDGANLIAADERNGRIVFSLDVAATVAGTTYVPGDLISWDGVALSPFDSQPAWPADRSSGMNSMSFLASPGEVSPTVTVERVGPAMLRLSWTSSSCSGGQDYGIYQGTIGVWYSHGRIDCDDAAPFLQEDVPVPAGDVYFLVVPHNDVNNVNPLESEEGSYGRDNNVGIMSERPPALPADACVSTQILGCSP